MNKNKDMLKAHSSEKGLSLVELLVSITLGAFLLTGVVSNFIGTKKSDKTRAALSEMDANGRTALNVLRQTILNAGYQSINNIRLETPFYTPKDGNLANKLCSDGSDRDVLTPQWNKRTRDGTRDFITVVTLADNPCKKDLSTCVNNADTNPNALIYYDCLGGGMKRDKTRVTHCSTDPDIGMTNPIEAKIYSSFWVKSNHQLYCQGSRTGTQPLVDNIESMQFLYGVKQENGTTAYLRANVVNSRDQWSYVTSVQVGLLVRSSTNVLSQPSTQTSYDLLDKKITIKNEDLRRLFRIYKTTINLENRNKGALL